jgi:hypothetical protein
MSTARLFLQIAAIAFFTVLIIVAFLNFAKRHRNPRLSTGMRTFLLGVVLLCICSVGGMLGFETISEYRDSILEKKEAKQHAEDMKRAAVETEKAKGIAAYLDSICHMVPANIGNEVRVLRKPALTRAQIEAVIGPPDYVSQDGLVIAYLAFAPGSEIFVPEDWEPTSTGDRLGTAHQKKITGTNDASRVLDSTRGICIFNFYKSDNALLEEKKGQLSDIEININTHIEGSGAIGETSFSHCDVFDYGEKCSYVSVR